MLDGGRPSRSEPLRIWDSRSPEQRDLVAGLNYEYCDHATIFSPAFENVSPFNKLRIRDDEQLMMILFPRFQLIEIEDQPWCPHWLREYSHAALAKMWHTTGPNRTSSTAAQACDILLENLPNPSSFTFVDACAGAGGPTPILEKILNQKLVDQGKDPVQFILTDLFPDLKVWAQIVKQSDNISFVKQPVDATKKTSRYADPGKKECRIFNLCFHHFDDEPAAKVLRSAVETTDAFM
ncbi:hypothetical protein NHQ30_003503 [Ciborinia camelliae]|nr:hypothetical protein NHQ30_003503 [Ciborinia camelliae]